MTAAWRHCSICKKDLAFGQGYYACSVSTCNRPRTGLFFCSVPCWDAHLPEARHREAWAVQETAPSEAAYRALQAGAAEESPAGEPRRRVISPQAQPADVELGEAADDILVVVSKLKKYVKDRSGMNTSDAVMSVLSDRLRRICDQAIRNAAADGRKTVLDRDFK